MERQTGAFPIKFQLPSRLELAMNPLFEAVVFAKHAGSDCWEFAVEMDTLLKMGLSLNDLRFLVRLDLVEHKREVTLESDNGRAFRPTGDLVFPTGTCFVLTPKGISLSHQLNCSSNSCESLNNSNLDHGSHTCDCTQVTKENSSSYTSQNSEVAIPCWDSRRRILTFGGTVVKHFKWAAENQEAVLAVFEEEGWPARIDDPLAPIQEQDSKRRLSDTIKCLNRKQSNALIHFRGDGTGEGVVWERVECNGTKSQVHFYHEGVG